MGGFIKIGRWHGPVSGRSPAGNRDGRLSEPELRELRTKARRILKQEGIERPNRRNTSSYYFRTTELVRNGKRRSVSLSTLLFGSLNQIYKKAGIPMPRADVLSRSDSPQFQGAFALSIDLCPSKAPYDRELFQYLDELGRRKGEKIPVAIALSGRWIVRHQKELDEIRRMNHLQITWVNHSYTHPLREGRFSTDPHFDFVRDAKRNRQALESHGLPPSRFYRFPGLRYNERRLRELRALGYVALGADAWFGKRQKIRSGSIVLIHGNGNNSPGLLDSFLTHMRALEPRILSGVIRIVPVDSYLETARSAAQAGSSTSRADRIL